MQVRDAIGSAAGERDNVIFDIAGACTGRATRRGARMLPLKFVLDGNERCPPAITRPGMATSATAKITDLVRLKHTTARMG